MNKHKISFKYNNNLNRDIRKVLIKNGIVISNIDDLMKKLTDRERDFLLDHFKIFDKYELICNTNTNTNHKIELIKNYCISLSISHKAICNILDYHLINKSNFDMIDKDDLRKILFLLNKLLLPSFSLPMTKSLYNYLIYVVDIDSYPEDEKVRELSNFLKQYDIYRTRESQLKWLNLKDKEQMEWAVKYLHSKYKLMRFFTSQNIHNYDYLTLITTSLDCHNFITESEKHQFIQRMSQSWSQKKFRDAGKTKTKHHLPLTKKAKADLKKLANFKNKSESEILEELISKAYLNEMCGDEGKALY